MKTNWDTLGRLRNAFYLISVALLILALATVQWLNTGRPAPLAPTPSPDVPLPTTNPDFITATPQGGNPVTATPAGRLLGLLPPTPVIPTPTPYPLLVNPNNETIPITWGDYPGPTSWPSLPIPPPLGVIPKPEGQINILLLGNDYRPRLGSRTDTIMLLTLNPANGTATVTSFPRDLYVYAPGYTMMKINTVQPMGGYDLLKMTFEYNFGVRPDYYVNVSMEGFVAVINALGGVRVYNPTPLSDPSYAGGKFSLSTGWHTLNGLTAKWYVRSRTTSNDFARVERQQAVLEAIFKKLLSIDGINRASELYNLYSRYVFTDIKLENITPLIPLAVQLSDTSRVSRLTVKPGMVTATRLPISGAFILLPDQTKILQLMLEALNPE